MKINMQGQVVTHEGTAYGPGVVKVPDAKTGRIIQKARDGALERERAEADRLRPQGLVTGVVNPVSPSTASAADDDDDDEIDDEIGTEEEVEDDETDPSLEAAIQERAAYIAKNANREEMNALANEVGVANPESYGTKAELADAISRAEHANRDNEEDEDEDEEEEEEEE